MARFGKDSSNIFRCILDILGSQRYTYQKQTFNDGYWESLRFLKSWWWKIFILINFNCPPACPLPSLLKIALEFHEEWGSQPRLNLELLFALILTWKPQQPQGFYLPHKRLMYFHCWPESLQFIACNPKVSAFHFRSLTDHKLIKIWFFTLDWSG